MSYDDRKVCPYESGRDDGRFVSSLGASNFRMRNLRPRLAFNIDFTQDEFHKWQSQVRSKLVELMGFPEEAEREDREAPKMLWRQKRDGYSLEKWELYPEPGSVVPFFVLEPESPASDPVPAVMCLPGSNGTKELLAGEPAFSPDIADRPHVDKNQTALDFVRKGFLAVASDNPGVGELAERSGTIKYDTGLGRDKLSRDMFYMGSSYLGLSVFHQMHILEYLKKRPGVDASKIALAGHSLGTEPFMVLAAIDESVAAVINNDFVHDKRVQDSSLAASMDGESIFYTGGMWHCVPGMWRWLDLSDVLCAVAPRLLLASEGGAGDALKKLARAWGLSGSLDNFTVQHFPKFDSSEKRPHENEPLPLGLHVDEYYERSHTDPPQHFFKFHLAGPWLDKVFL